jgi:cell wall assembly regulator SMI1
VDEIWRRIELWLKHNARPVLRSLRKGATEKDIAGAEDALGRSLPDDFRQSLLRHDGQQPDRTYGTSFGLAYENYLYPVSKAVRVRQTLVDLLDKGLGRDLEVLTEGPVRAVWWDRGWLPFVEDGGNNPGCVDLHPAAGGRVGQVIQFWSQNHLRSVLARSFRGWLGRFADALEEGGYVYSAAHRGLLTVRNAISEGVIPRPQPPAREEGRRNPRRGKSGGAAG